MMATTAELAIDERLVESQAKIARLEQALRDSEERKRICVDSMVRAITAHWSTLKRYDAVAVRSYKLARFVTRSRKRMNGRMADSARQRESLREEAARLRDKSERVQDDLDLAIDERRKSDSIASFAVYLLEVAYEYLAKLDEDMGGDALLLQSEQLGRRPLLELIKDISKEARECDLRRHLIEEDHEGYSTKNSIS